MSQNQSLYPLFQAVVKLSFAFSLADPRYTISLLFSFLMNVSRLIQFTLLCSALLLGSAQQAAAQEDESWYREYVRKRAQQHTTVPKASSARAGGAAQRVSVCDVGINGDFEDQNAQPTRTGNMGGELTGQTAPDQLKNWYSPSFATPDYLATNAPATSDVQPNYENSVFGSSTPFSDNGHIGLYTRQQFTDTAPRDRVAEYASVRLPNALIAGARYYAELRVSLAHGSFLTNYGITSGFGMLFTPGNVNNIGTRDFLPFPTTPYQTIFNTTPIGQSAINNGILGSTNWQRISGQLDGTAGGQAMQYLTIGLFNSNASNQTLLPGRDATRPNTYFFVDAVQVFKIPTVGAAPATLCTGSAVTLGEGCDIPGASYAWTTTGNNTPFANTIQTTVRPTTTTTYVLTVRLPDGSTYPTSATVRVLTADPQGLYGNFYTHRYDGCRRYYNVRMQQVPGATRYVANVGVGGNTAEGGAEGIVDTQTGNVIFPVDIEGAGYTITAHITVFINGSCSGRQDFEFSEYLYGPDPNCGGPGPGQTTIAAPYPNPASSAITLPVGVESATLLDNHGQTVRVLDGTNKIDVRTLPAGLYNLHMRQDGKVINKHIQVSH